MLIALGLVASLSFIYCIHVYVVNMFYISITIM